VGDAFRIRQIVENLMSNALKFTDKGTISLAVGLKNGDLSFTVADTGLGMEAGRMSEDIQRIHPAP
jgi:signal transduction histidine kinase